MNLIGLSINHKTAPIELREALHLSKDEILDLISLLKSSIFSEGFVLSTCNRTEIFGFPREFGLNYKDFQNLLLGFKPVSGISSENFLKYFSCGAIKHIFSVASGVDSLIIGDSQILGQIKDSFEVSEDLGFAGPVMKRIFDTAVRVGKRSIKETFIGEGAVTVSYASVQVVEKIFANLSKKSAIVIGAGETGELAAVHLKDKGIGGISICNRTLSKAETLAGKLRADITPFEYFKEHLHSFDIIITATSADNYIIDKKDIIESMRKRRGVPTVIMDIAVPRDVDPDVRKIDNVFYHDIDSLNVIIDQNLKNRMKEIPRVERIIEEEMINLFGWYNALDVVPAIKSMREFFEEIKNDELKKIRHKVTDEDYTKLEDMARRLIGRLLHNPTVTLRELAESGTDLQEVQNYSLMMMNLFKLTDHENLMDKEKEKIIE